MKKSPPAASPDAYVAALSGWHRVRVESLRRTAAIELNHRVGDPTASSAG